MPRPSSQDGQEQADRDDSKQALKMDADNIGITFIITQHLQDRPGHRRTAHGSRQAT